MGHKMDKQEYAKCIEDDIDFLKRNLPESLFKCLWTGHIIEVLKASINMLYDQPSLHSVLEEESEKPINLNEDLNFALDKYIGDLDEELHKRGCTYEFDWDDITETIREAGNYFAKWQKEQMMKEAVEGVLVDNIDGTKDICLHENRFGDKVRIIIVKEDEK